MATREDVRTFLMTLANALNKTDRWVDQVEDLWTQKLGGYPPEALTRAADSIVENMSRLPTLAEVKGVLANLGIRTERAQGCAECLGEGTRYGFRRWRASGALRSSAAWVSLSCSCEAGRRLLATHRDWEEWYQSHQADSETLWVSTAAQQSIPLEVEFPIDTHPWMHRGRTTRTGAMRQAMQTVEAGRREVARPPPRDWSEPSGEYEEDAYP